MERFVGMLRKDDGRSEKSCVRARKKRKKEGRERDHDVGEGTGLFDRWRVQQKSWKSARAFHSRV